MKLIREFVATLLMALAVVSIASMAHAQTFQLANMIVTTPCTSVPITGVSANLICIDSSTGLLYYPGASGMTAISSSGSSGLVITGKTSGAVTLQSSTGTYNYNFPTTAGAVGAILTSGGGGAATNTNFWLPDVATGSVLTSAGTTTVPAFSSTLPSALTIPSPTVNEQTITGGVQASSTGYNAFTITSPVCTTSGAGGVCAEPTHTFAPTGFADANYFITCSCNGTNAGVPVVDGVTTKASNAVVVTIAGVTSVSASCSNLDCIAIHN